MLYFDHSATTPLHPDVLELMHSIARNDFGNPSSIHRLGQKSRSVIENARRQMASAIKAKPLDIIFTGSGTEANNIILWSLVHQKNKHVIISSIEHPAVYKTLRFLKPFGVEMTEVPVSGKGLVNPDDIQNAIRPDTALVSIMMANNEVGSVQPVREISRICRENNVLFHSDAVQAPGKLEIDVNNLGIDFMSFSAHKFYGPKGVGSLYLRSAANLKGLVQGGGQERKLRAGTENVPGIAGIGLAAEISASSLENSQSHLETLASTFRNHLKGEIPSVIFNGDSDTTLPGLVSTTIPDIKSDMLMVHLSRMEISVSSGSACSSGSISPSHVLKAMGISNALNMRTIRVSFGRDNSLENVTTLVNALVEARKRILKVSR